MATIFDGEEKNVNRLTDLFSDGKMLTGKGKGGGFDNSRNHTTNWYREKAIERAIEIDLVLLKLVADMTVDWCGFCVVLLHWA